jgi:ATP-dependent exoDNAse (exonuclease V) beta subunit
VGQVDIVQWVDYEAELNGIANFISAEIKKGDIEPADVLVLTPRRKIGYRLRDLLTILEVPVKSYFRESVIDSKEVQRAFSLMNLLANPEDKISLRYLLGYNTGDFRKKQYRILKEKATENHISVIEVLNSVLHGQTPETNIKAITTSYRSVMNDLPNLRESLLDDPENGFQNYFITNDQLENDFFELDQVYRNVVEEIGTDNLDDPESFDDWFQKVMKAILETIALPDSPENIDHARIMSLHSSKGLSAKLVVSTSMIDPLIPFIPRDTPAEDRERVIQEARRLFYVAITRCKASDNYDGRLIISSFLSIAGTEALQMNMRANPRRMLRTRTTRFVTDFGNISPAPKKGEQLE